LEGVTVSTKTGLMKLMWVRQLVLVGLAASWGLV
jgi:hypothetical protein